MYYLVTFLYVLVCAVLMIVVLLQQGKGGDIASAFGGSGSQAAFGARSGATVLSRATTICAVLFMFFALVLGIVGKNGGAGSSVVGGRTAPAPAGAPAAPASAPAPAASTPAPAQTPAPAPAK